MLAGILGLLSLGASPSGYQVSKKVPLPGTGGWDYLTVDENARRLYVSHATQVVVLNADTLEVVGTIPDLAGVHGIEYPCGHGVASQIKRRLLLSPTPSIMCWLKSTFLLFRYCVGVASYR